ncbi:MAG: short-chain dehydrogenase/reductase [Aeromicrobium sp.]|jgi:NAD(P)-dependent dehydrogenase (short-subunit alcohol dehydrogenase family)|nr:short-chain dehydrogenase/reductase [Aeromicrobium sp.]
MAAENVAIVVGAGGGLGRAVAVNLAESGATVVAVDRNQVALDALPATVRREVADVTDPAAAKPLVDRIAREVAPPDVLVNTMGAFSVGDALSATADELALMVNVNLGPALWLTQAVAPYMIDRGSGAMVHVAARPGVEPTAGYAAYGASKAALVQLVRVLDLELRPRGIRVNAIAPALIATEKNKTLLPPDLLAHAVSPDAIAAVVAFLISDAAAPVSGAIVPTYGA